MTKPSTKVGQIPLVVSQRLTEIIDNWRDGLRPVPRDINYLINEAGRYDSIVACARNCDLSIIDWKTALNELNTFEAVKIMGGIFNFELSYFHPSIDDVETLSVSQIRKKVEEALHHVRIMQESYDANEKEVEVIGRFTQLSRHYGMHVWIKADSSVEETTNTIVEMVIERIQDECLKKQAAIERFKNEQKAS